MADTDMALIETAVMDVVLSREGKRRYNNGDPLTLDPSDLRDIVRLTMAKCAALASRPAEVDGLLSAEQVFRLFGLPDPAGLAADYSVEKALQLLREARAVLETWKDVAPAVSLCADIDKVLAGGGR